MANIQHIYSGEVDPNIGPVEAPAGSHYENTLTGVPWILSSTGVWHPVFPLVRGNGSIQYQAEAPVGSLFVSAVESSEQVFGVRMENGWTQMASIESMEDPTGSTPSECAFIVDTANNRLCVKVGSEFKYVELIDFM